MIGLLVAIIGPLLKVQPAPPHVPHGAQQVEVFRASPRYLAYRYLNVALGYLPVSFLWGVVTFALFAERARSLRGPALAVGFSGVGLLALLVSAAFAFASVRLEYEFHCYVITDRSLRIRQGIWEQIEATLTYANVQNVRVIQGPLERLFHFSSVVVDTAGGSAKPESQDPGLRSHRGVIRGIENANALRDRIMLKLKESRSSGLGDPDEHHDPAPEIAALDPAVLREIRDEARALAAELRGP